MSEKTDSISRGVWIAIGLQLTYLLFCFATVRFTYIQVAFWGVGQWIFLLPAIVYQRRRGFRERAKGMMIIGFIAILLNSACAVFVFGGLGRLVSGAR
jgi:hypothetical protein